MNVRELEAEAVAAHLARAEPHNRRRYHKLVGRLLHLLTTGEASGAEPIDTGWERPCQWELDNAMEPAR